MRSICWKPCGRLLTGPLPTGDFLLPALACPGQPVSITNTSPSTLNVRWNFGDNTPIDIKLWVSNGGLCADSVYKQDVVRVDTCALYVATIFTPNNDGRSEFFNLYGTNVSRIKELHIFSRWGNEVYVGKDLTPNTQTEGWDGKQNNRALPPDNYVYEAIVEFVGGATSQKRGVITLLR